MNDHSTLPSQGLPDRHAPWGQAAAPPAVRPPLRADVRVGTLIVGAGLAGLSTALHLCESGETPLVLEAGLIGRGATGSSAGIIAPQLIRATPDSVLARLGEARGAGVLQMVAECGTYLFDLIDRHQIACDATRKGFIAPATGAKSHARLQSLADQWHPWRSGLQVCDAVETMRLTGCKGYGASIVDSTGGALDPLLLALGLASRAESMGATVHEHSQVTSLIRVGGAWRATTGSGSVTADRVVLAANGGSGPLFSKLAGTVLPLPVCEVATEPLPAALREHILPGGHSLTDLEPDVFSIRYTGDGRLVTAFPAQENEDLRKISDRVNARLSRMLVKHQRLRLDHVWFGTAWINSNLLPRLVSVPGAEGLIAVQACNGRGLAINTLIGREVARTLRADAHAPLLSLDSPRPVSGFLLAKHLPRMLMSGAMVFKRLRKSLEH